MARYGLQVESSYNLADYQPLIISVKPNETKEITRTQAGLLAISLGENAKLSITEDITAPGFYHTYVYQIEQGSSVFITTKISSEGETDVSHVVHSDVDNSQVSLKVKGIAGGDSKIYYTSTLQVADALHNVTAMQQADFLQLSEQAQISAIPTIISNSSEADVSHAVSVREPEEDILTYLKLKGCNDQQALDLYCSSFLT